MAEKKFKLIEMASFWNWIKENKDYVGVQYNDETKFQLYIGFNKDALNSFVKN